MTFKDNTGKEIFTLRNFYKRYNDLPIFIETEIEVFFDNASKKENFEFELSDFEDLRNFFVKADGGLIKYFVFQNLEEQFSVSFEIINNENCKISGYLKDKMYLSELNFSFIMSNSDLNYLANYLDIIISNFDGKAGNVPN